MPTSITAFDRFDWIQEMVGSADVNICEVKRSYAKNQLESIFNWTRTPKDLDRLFEWPVSGNSLV